MAGKMTAGHVDGLFIDRPSDHAVDAADSGQIYSFFDERHGGSAGFWSRHTELIRTKRFLQGIQHRDLGRARRQLFMSFDGPYIELELQLLDRLLHDAARSDHEWKTEPLEFRSRERLGNHLRTNPGRSSHGDTEEWKMFRLLNALHE